MSMTASPRQIQLNRSLTQTQRAEEVLQIVRDGLEEFNLVNCTTALHRLAKAMAFGGKGGSKGGGKAKGGKSKHACSSELEPLLARTSKLVKEAGTKTPPQNMSNALWALERLGLDLGHQEAASLASTARNLIADSGCLAKFSGQNLANTAWAVAKMLSGRPASTAVVGSSLSSEKFFSPFIGAIADMVWYLNGQELSMAAWALATAGGETNAKSAMGTLCEAALALPITSLSAQQLATLAWSCARLGCRVETVLNDIAKAAAPCVERGDFNAQDLSNMAWAFGRLDMPAPKLLEALTHAVSQNLKAPAKSKGKTANSHSSMFSSQQLAVLAWALARMGVKHHQVLLAIAEEARNRIHDLSLRDITDVVWALAHTGVQDSAFLQVAGQKAKKQQAEFGTQELLRFLGAFRRAGGDTAVQADMASAQRELKYDFPALGGVQVALHGETPGQRHTTRHRVRASELQDLEELGGDPQRADGGTTGVALWEASFVLAEWLSRQGGAGNQLSNLLVAEKKTRLKWKRWDDKIGVELGAGLGLPSIIASHLGARVTATDGDSSVMRLLRQNVEQNPGSGMLKAQALLWGTPEPLSKLGIERVPDFLLLADVIYASAKEALTKQLLDTILALTNLSTVVIISNVRRFPEGHPEGEGRFFADLDRLFHRKTVPQDYLHQDFQRSGVGSCAVHILSRKVDPGTLLPKCVEKGQKCNQTTKTKTDALISPGKRLKKKRNKSILQTSVNDADASLGNASRHNLARDITSKTTKTKVVPLSGSPANQPESPPQRKRKRKQRASCAKDSRPGHAPDYKPAGMMTLTPAAATAITTVTPASPVTAATAATSTTASAKRKGKYAKTKATATSRLLPTETSLLRASTKPCRKRRTKIKLSA